MRLSYEEIKKRKLKRLWGLRIMSWLGMVGWRNVSGDPKQKLRLLHPLTIPWILLLVVLYVFAYGFFGVWRDTKEVLLEETVWW